MVDVIVQEPDLKDMVVRKLTSAGLPREHALVVADVLVHADLRGVHSHGVLRTEHYVKRIRQGGVNPEPDFTFRPTGTVAGVFDGDDGMGHVVMKEAMNSAIALAKEYGIGVVGVVNSSHSGALSYFVQQAVGANMIGLAMTQTDKAVVPFGGATPYFGTNPIAYGFPAARHRPVILDMATSSVAFGKVLHAREVGAAIPPDWGVDELGRPCTDPHRVVALLPFAGPKGYGLAMVVDILCGILTGSAFGPHIQPMYQDYDKMRKLGHFVCAMDPGLFMERSDFLMRIDQMIDELHEVAPAAGFDRVLVPGEPEQILHDERIKQGIPVPESLYRYLST
ncbi:ureidoglycolate dehydrogenase [Alicyclobacillus herbarius]|uniref:ureidoglycolate dehydrogenase n=1 Tax=Alicyclobacillus herbarius TaxID=122960 RepID=UPI00047CD8E5|nr:ureidoglycolate dehydrogenase [Alicyclobacillus herbarius]